MHQPYTGFDTCGRCMNPSDQLYNVSIQSTVPNVQGRGPGYNDRYNRRLTNFVDYGLFRTWLLLLSLSIFLQKISAGLREGFS